MRNPNRLMSPLQILVTCLALSPAFAQDDMPFCRLFDTGIPAPGPLSAAAMEARKGWRMVAEEVTRHTFTGAAVFLNNKLAVVFRSQAPGAEVHARTGAGFVLRARLGHVSAPTRSPSPITALRLVENTSGAIMVAATFSGPGAGDLQVRLTAGEAILDIRSEAGTGGVTVTTQAKHVVLPDYFGDDMIFDPAPPTGRYLPAENFFTNLIDGGNAIVMPVWQSSDQNAWLSTPAANAPAGTSMAVIDCARDQSIWLAFLEAPGIWHSRPLSTVANWGPPFPANWRCSLPTDTGRTDSWPLATGTDLRQTEGARSGPVVIYPIDRSRKTPLTVSCPTDVVRNTLGVGPCQYILAVEGLTSDTNPTPSSVMEWVEKQFERKRDRKRADEILERLAAMVNHVAHTRERIGVYADFAVQARRLMAGDERGDQLLAIINDMDGALVEGLASTAASEHAGPLAFKVSALVGSPNALMSCRRLGEQLGAIGTTQDRALARCRMAVRRIRQQARTILATKPQNPNLLEEAQKLAEDMLQRK